MTGRSLLSRIGCAASIFRLAIIAACLTASLSAQQVPLALDPQWEELAEGITFQVSGDKAAYSLDIEDCPELRTQCIVVTNNGATVYLTYSLDATPLRGQRVRFAASMLVDYPGISIPLLFMRVDRPAGVGFHEYTPRDKDERDWATRELIGTSTKTPSASP